MFSKVDLTCRCHFLFHSVRQFICPILPSNFHFSFIPIFGSIFPFSHIFMRLVDLSLMVMARVSIPIAGLPDGKRCSEILSREGRIGCIVCSLCTRAPSCSRGSRKVPLFVLIVVCNYLLLPLFLSFICKAFLFIAI